MPTGRRRGSKRLHREEKLFADLTRFFFFFLLFFLPEKRFVQLTTKPTIYKPSIKKKWGGGII